MSQDSIDDVIDHLAGIAPGSALDAVRAQRPAARRHAQQSHQALFAPALHAGGFARWQRHAVAAFVARLHQQPAVAAFHAEQAQAQGADPGLLALIDQQAADAALQGPYGSYPAGPLSAEDRDGPLLRIAAGPRGRIGEALAAALEHAHLLVLHPRDASSAALQALRHSGWSTPDIVTLSQLIAFLSFQIRVVQGLQALGRPAAGPVPEATRPGLAQAA
jgi:CMD domain protein